MDWNRGDFEKSHSDARCSRPPGVHTRQSDLRDFSDLRAADAPASPAGAAAPPSAGTMVRASSERGWPLHSISNPL